MVLNIRCSVLIALFSCITLASSERLSYEGYKVWLVQTETENQLELLSQWKQNESVDFWEPLSSIGKSVRIMVEPSTQTEFIIFLEQQNIQNELIINNVESVFKEERDYDAMFRLQNMTSRIASEFNHFWELQEINEYIAFLQRNNPDLVSTEIVGYSTEGRPLNLVRISLAGRGQVTGERPIVFIDAAIHAREWAAPHAALYILKQLIENRSQNAAILQRIDFLILPMINPDGYQYTKTVQRLWRKNRRTFPGNPVCVGVDGNRNYAYMWLSAEQTNVNTCSETYPGTGPFSEPETQAVRNLLNRYTTAIKIYVSIHAYGNYVLYPWGYERRQISNFQLHDQIGRIYADTIRQTTGTVNTVGNSAIVLYPASGGSDDFAASVGVQASFTFELTGGGRNGFDLPAYQLDEVVRENWVGFRDVLLFAAQRNWN